MIFIKLEFNHVSFIEGEVYSWGLNSHGQLGLLHKNSPIREPQYVHSLSGIPLCLIKAGGQFSAALTQIGFLLTWGSNKYGQLGRNTDQLSFW